MREGRGTAESMAVAVTQRDVMVGSDANPTLGSWQPSDASAYLSLAGLKMETKPWPMALSRPSGLSGAAGSSLNAAAE